MHCVCSQMRRPSLKTTFPIPSGSATACPESATAGPRIAASHSPGPSEATLRVRSMPAPRDLRMYVGIAFIYDLISVGLDWAWSININHDQSRSNPSRSFKINRDQSIKINQAKTNQDRARLIKIKSIKISHDHLRSIRINLDQINQDRSRSIKIKSSRINQDQ